MGGAAPFTLRPPFSSSPPPTLSFAPTPPFPPRPACPQVRALPWAPRMPGRALRFVRFGGAARVCFLHAAAEKRGAVAPAARSRPLCPPPPRPGFVWSPGPHWRGLRGQTGWTARTIGVRFVAGVARSRTKRDRRRWRRLAAPVGARSSGDVQGAESGARLVVLGGGRNRAARRDTKRPNKKKRDAPPSSSTPRPPPPTLIAAAMADGKFNILVTEKLVGPGEREKKKGG